MLDICNPIKPDRGLLVLPFAKLRWALAKPSRGCSPLGLRPTPMWIHSLIAVGIKGGCGGEAGVASGSPRSYTARCVFGRGAPRGPRWPWSMGLHFVGAPWWMLPLPIGSSNHGGRRSLSWLLRTGYPDSPGQRPGESYSMERGEASRNIYEGVLLRSTPEYCVGRRDAMERRVRLAPISRMRLYFQGIFTGNYINYTYFDWNFPHIRG